MRAAVSVFVFLIAMGISGCGSGGPPKAKLFPVKGRVTLNGKPLGGCTLLLVALKTVPGADDSYVGVLSDKGEFELASPLGKAGAAAGTYKVTFSTGRGGSATAPGVMDPKEMMEATMKGTLKNQKKELPYPKEFESAASSKKEVQIAPDQNELLIAI